ncbi:uncharacterized protein LOC127092715 [Lathyrus oleraceus]|uniref:Uncharacterized protein n=1 Tax=Pisum sativum TaxID=3888 RepID=A0A9D4WCR6_PEA|nr:uncharacterized protein LOC127092715 [Pisum sativum]KAI5399094.1 hypothetical protein KIW84_064461 [Pisum sativum]
MSNLSEQIWSSLDSMNNLNSLLSSLTPFVEVKFSSKTQSKGSKSGESLEKPYFVLEDLWESFKRWSAYGVEVQFNLTSDEQVLQYFVPYLSAIQLYAEDEESDKKSSEKSGDSVSSKETTNKVVYEYFENHSPYVRLPLTKKVSNLAKDDPCIKNLRSSEISPRSWFSVAWYPIYRIPNGPTLSDIKASFLTYHNLSTEFKRKTQPEISDNDRKLKTPLPVFGLTTYKVKGSVLPFPAASESRRLNSLLKAADDWLKNLKVVHCDHNHFVKNGKQWVD